MNPKELEENYQKNKNKFHSYIDNIKSNMKVNIYSVINTTIICNPYATSFPKKFFSKDYEIENRFLLFMKSSIKFYLKHFYFLLIYFISFLIYKIYYKKSYKVSNKTICIDIFFLVDDIIKDKKFNEKYFLGLSKVLKKYQQEYIYVPRLYGINKNPFKLIKLFKILNKDTQKFLFEFELIKIKDFILLLYMIIIYPFKTISLLQKKESIEDKLLNNELISDIKNQQFDAFSRYIFGKNIANIEKIEKIYSWSEFQVIERAFNYGIRSKNKNIEIIACQFYLNYETYFNSYIDDIDFEMLSSPHKVLVNGEYYILERKKVQYKRGVSLRYKDIFSFSKIGEKSSVLLLGSYIEKDTKYMLDSVDKFDSVLFKNHPVIDIQKFGRLEQNIKVVDSNIYELFKDSSIVIGTASGTAVEAVACGLSVIIIASQDNLTANPLVDYGKGKIWDIAFNKDDIEKLYNKLLKYREKNINEIEDIALWYKDNFFVKPTEENIVKVFEINRRK